MANKRLIARINVLLNQVKRDNDISISRTLAHTAADNPLARGNAEADKVAAKGRTARRLETLTRGPCSLPSSPPSGILGTDTSRTTLQFTEDSSRPSSLSRTCGAALPSSHRPSATPL